MSDERKRARNGEGSSYTDKNGVHHFIIQTSIIKPDGSPYKIHTISHLSQLDAKEKGLKRKKQKEKQEKLGVLGNKYTGKETFGFWFGEYLKFKSDPGTETKHRINESTLRSYMSIYNKLLSMDIGKTQLKQLNVKTFQKYFDDLRYSSKSSHSVNGYCGLKNRQITQLLCIQTIEYINKQGIELENYAKLAVVYDPQDLEVSIDYVGEEEDEEGRPALTTEECSKVLEYARQGQSVYGWLMVLQLCCGARESELFALINSCIEINEDQSGGRIHIVKALAKRKRKSPEEEMYYLKLPKNNETRWAFFNDIGVEAINNLRRIMKMKRPSVENKKDLLVYNIHGMYVSDDTYRDCFCRMCMQCDIYRPHGTGPHLLRKTYITRNNVDNGVNPMLTMQAVGHHDLEIDTKTYTKPNSEQIQKSLFEPFAESKKESNEEKLMKLIEEQNNKLKEQADLIQSLNMTIKILTDKMSK